MQKHQGSTISREEALWVLADLCEQHRRPFDPSLFLAKHPMGETGVYTVADLVLLVAEALGVPPSTLVCKGGGSPFHGRGRLWHDRRHSV